MKKSDRGSLATVARLRELELEHARLQHAAAVDALSRQEQVLTDIRARLDDSHTFAREQAQSSHGISAALLLHVRAYSQLQTRLAEQQRERVDEAENGADRARAEVTRRFQALAAIERLRERRAAAAAIEAERAGQKLLDEHALVREARKPSNGEDSSWQSTRSE
jgi:flagellar export protein FliJ